MHICHLQFDVVKRLIDRHSNEGEVVLDPFAGLMTVPYWAVKMSRKGYGIEINAQSFTDGLNYLRAAEQEKESPDLFKAIESEESKDINQTECI